MKKNSFMRRYLLLAGIVLAFLAVTMFGISSANTMLIGNRLIESMSTQKLMSDINLFKLFLSERYGLLRLDEEGQLEGTVGGLIEGDANLVTFLSSSLGAEVTIFKKDDSDFVRVATSLKNENGNLELGSVLDSDSPAWNALNTGEELVGETVILGRSFLSLYEPVKTPAGDIIAALGLAIPMDQILEKLYAATWNSLWQMAVASLIIAVLSLLILGRGMRNRIGVLAESVDALEKMASGQGNLAQRLTVDGRDEIANLAKHFNTFISKLHDMIFALREVATRNKDQGDELVAEITSISFNLEGMKQGVESLSAQTSSTLKETVDVSENVEHINGFLEEVVGLVEEQVSSFEQSSAAIEEISSNIRNLAQVTGERNRLSTEIADEAREGEAGMEQMTESIAKIQHSSSAIAEMIEIINGVAEQTNMLAMNAAIEAAHAGDAGKGFGVVADEIRTLAEKTAENAATIASQLGEMVKDIDLTSEISGKTGEKIATVIAGVSNISLGMEEMSSSMSELDTGAAEVSDALGKLNSLSQSVKDSTMEVKKNIEDVRSSAMNLSENSNRNAMEIQEIEERINGVSTAMISLEKLSKKTLDGNLVLDKEIGLFVDRSSQED